MRIFGVVALVCVCMADAALAGKKDKGDKSKGKEPPPGAADASPTPKFSLPIPVGHTGLGVKLPYYDERGKLQMYFVIDKAFRTDLNHVELKNAYMQTYDEKQTPDATIFMTHSLLDLNTRIVTSEVPVTVRRPDFDIVGQKMVFNTQTRAGRMTGHVQMTIYNRQTTMQPSPSPAAAHDASPAPSATAKTPAP